MSLARDHKRKSQAQQQQAHRVHAATQKIGGTIYVALDSCLRNLSNIQSRAKKIAYKKQHFAEFWPHVEGKIDAQHPLPDDIVGEMMVWAIDTNQFAKAMQAGQALIDTNTRLPERFDRSPAVFLTEESGKKIIEMWAGEKQTIIDNAAQYLQTLTAIAEKTSAIDMPDEARAKIYKAIGIVAEAYTDTEKAIAAYKKALALYPKIGVKLDITRLEKSLPTHKQHTAQAQK